MTEPLWLKVLRGVEEHLLEPKGDVEMANYCYDEKHDEPCPLPCEACADECDDS